jgi:hypothetical protein
MRRRLEAARDVTLFQALYGILHSLWGSWQLKDLVCFHEGQSLQEAILELPQPQAETLRFDNLHLKQPHLWFARFDYWYLRKKDLLITHYTPAELDLDMLETTRDFSSPAKIARLIAQRDQVSSDKELTIWMLEVVEDHSATGPYEGDLIHIVGMEYPYQGWPKKVSSWSLL